MKRLMVRYRTRPDVAAENERLIGAVFRELHAKAPDGVRYAALRLDGDVFVHLVAVEDDAANPIPALEAFKAFQQGIRDRCVEAPEQIGAKVIGNFGMLGD